jgi:hypothetical protein
MILLIFGAPWLVIYLQSRKIAEFTRSLDQMRMQVSNIENALKAGRSSDA